MSANAGNRSDDKAMQSTALPVAGQRMAESSDSLTSAPRGILFNPIPNILRQKKFDGTRGGQRIDIWLEETDKSLVINPEIFRLWKGQGAEVHPSMHLGADIGRDSSVHRRLPQ